MHDCLKGWHYPFHHSRNVNLDSWRAPLNHIRILYHETTPFLSFIVKITLVSKLGTHKVIYD